MFFHMMGALAQFERDLIRERTMAGLKAARDRSAQVRAATAPATTTDTPTKRR
jgi:DNA invertase Pin-like site-specific DNA recombinase